EQVQNVPGEDRCVLLLGYREEMEDFLRGANPGLERRFALNNAFQFDDYNDEELLSILRIKLEQEQLQASVPALMAAAGVLSRRRNTSAHFGNGGEVANLLSEAKQRKELRRKDDSAASRQGINRIFDLLQLVHPPTIIPPRLDPELLPEDFDHKHNKLPPSSKTLGDELFGDLIGCDMVKEKLMEIRSAFILAQNLGRDPREMLSLNFRFTGSPGTGKTTVAQRMGKMFKELGVLQSEGVVSCSPSDFVTGYIGQTAIKTKAKVEEAIGKVLFIDEAYGLNPHHAGRHSFMQEAVDQLVQCLTDERYKGNLVCVVAGYAADIDALMTANPGLASRFPQTVHFPDFDVKDSSLLLKNSLDSM
ncbi:unnamed protein product, partial [Choristocarpus tenellus]